MWLGVIKYVKNCTAELPEEFKPIYEKAQPSISIPAFLPPSKLNRDGKLVCIAPSEVQCVGLSKIRYHTFRPT